MKLQVVGRTDSPGQGLSYLSDRGATGQAFGAGVAEALGGIGESALGLSLQAQENLAERNDKTERFSALKSLSDFQLRTSERLLELKRGSAPDNTQFAEQADAEYLKMEQDFLKYIPDRLKPEMASRTAQMRTGLVGNALEFQYTQQDAFFKEGLNEEYNRAKVEVGQDPANYEVLSRYLAEAIATTDLPEAEKGELARNMNAGLSAIVYGKRVEQIQRAAAPAIAGSADEMAAGLLRDFEGFREGAYYDVDAYRSGYGSDTITRADGTIEQVGPNSVVTRDDAERDLQRRIREFKNIAIATVGDTAWSALSPQAQAALVSVTYNYGRLPANVAAAVKVGDVEAIASAVEKLSSNPERRAKEASVIRGGTTAALSELDSDPQFAGISYEDRLAMQGDAQRRVNEEQVAAAKAAKEALDARRNDLYTRLYDGTAGEVDIAAERKSGVLSDIDAIEKAQAIFDKRNAAFEGRRHIQSMLDNPAMVYNTATDNDDFNKWLGKEGLSSVSARDGDYFTKAIIPAVGQLHDIPTDLVGQLEGMARSNNQQNSMFAFDALSQLQQVDARAFDARVGEKLAKDVDLWQSRKDYMPMDELMKTINGGLTTAERQQTRSLREEAMSILTTKDPATYGVDSIPHISTLVNKIVADYGYTFGTDPTLTNVPWAAKGMEADFQGLFVEAYTKYGNEKDATAAAVKTLQRQWDVTEVGGAPLIMKFPPQKVGYQTVDGSYAWIDEQVRSELALGPDETFQLLSDEQTRKEFVDWQSGQGKPPSYMIATLKDGLWGIVTLPNGLPDRRYFERNAPAAGTFEQENKAYLDAIERAGQPELVAPGLGIPAEVP